MRWLELGLIKQIGGSHTFGIKSFPRLREKCVSRNESIKDHLEGGVLGTIGSLT